MAPNALRHHLSALRMLLVFTVFTGVVYPLLVTAVARTGFSHEADGSLLTTDGTTVASSLIGQNFTLPRRRSHDPDEVPRPDPAWFQPRPSAGGYRPTNSGASNLGPNNKELIADIRARRAAVAAFDGVSPRSVPADAVTASGSGLDPAISPAYAYEQVERVAQARHLAPSRVREMVAQHVQGRELGFLGRPHVNVVELNHALTRLGR